MAYYPDPFAALVGLVGILLLFLLIARLFKSPIRITDTYTDMEIGAVHGYVRKNHPEILKELTLMEVSEKSKFRQKLEQRVVEEYFPEPEEKPTKK